MGHKRSTGALWITYAINQVNVVLFSIISKVVFFFSYSHIQIDGKKEKEQLIVLRYPIQAPFFIQKSFPCLYLSTLIYLGFICLYMHIKCYMSSISLSGTLKLLLYYINMEQKRVKHIETMQSSLVSLSNVMLQKPQNFYFTFSSCWLTTLPVGSGQNG